MFQHLRVPSKDLHVKNDAPIDPYRDMDLLERPFGHAFRNFHYLQVNKTVSAFCNFQSKSEKDIKNRNLKIGRGSPFFFARLFGHKALGFSHSVSNGKYVRKTKSNVPGPWPGMYFFVPLLLMLMKFDIVAEMVLSTTRESKKVKVRSR